jgi:hypothetical protein
MTQIAYALSLTLGLVLIEGGNPYPTSAHFRMCHQFVTRRLAEHCDPRELPIEKSEGG